MKKIIFLLSIFLLFSCEDTNAPQHITIKQSKENFDIEFLFEVDSVRVYRFRDGGRDVYFSNSYGRINYSYTTRVGKSGVIHHEQTTLSN